ncbi:hypothetical protein ABW365_21970 [Enterococcus avium]
MNKKEGGGSIIGSDRDLWDFVWDCRNILSDLYLFFVPQESKNQGADQGRVWKKPEWKLDERDYASMKKYYQQKKTDGPTIDDITFNDLNMDEIFKQVKNTQSSIGDEYSYDFFRRQKNPDLTHFEAAVQCMSEQAEAGKNCNLPFIELGGKPIISWLNYYWSPVSFLK